jgi:hypothetical protein
MKILKYKLILNAQNNLSIPEYITDGGYFSSNGNNDEWLVGVSNSESVPEGCIELSVSDLVSYVSGLTLNKLDEESNEYVEMTNEEKEALANSWATNRGF